MLIGSTDDGILQQNGVRNRYSGSNTCRWFGQRHSASTRSSQAKIRADAKEADSRRGGRCVEMAFCWSCVSENKET
jgi:hypothetical protein